MAVYSSYTGLMKNAVFGVGGFTIQLGDWFEDEIETMVKLAVKIPLDLERVFENCLTALTRR